MEHRVYRLRPADGKTEFVHSYFCPCGQEPNRGRVPALWEGDVVYMTDGEMMFLDLIGKIQV